jgi:protein-tyrosine phosphatase
MIDIHSHILPGIDDGAQSLDDSLAMARIAVESGTRLLVATPHIHPGRYANQRENIARAVADLRQALAGHGIPLQLAMGAEVRLCPEVIPLIGAGQVPFLGEQDGFRWILLELPHSHVPTGSEKMIDWLYGQKIRVLLAHPERNKGFLADPERVRPFLDRRCKFQVTAGSVAGKFGERVRLFAEELLRRSAVSVLASDAHNTDHRTPDLLPGLRRAEQLIGRKKAGRLVYYHPHSIIQSQLLAQGLSA